LYAVLAWGSACAAWAGGGEELCEGYLLRDLGERSVEESAHLDDTSGLIAYLEQLLESQVLQTSDIEQMLEGLVHSELLNPLMGALGPANLVHRRNLDAWLEKQSLDVRRLEAWAKQTVEKRGLTRVQRDEVRAETESLYVKANYILVPQRARRWATNLAVGLIALWGFGLTVVVGVAIMVMRSPRYGVRENRVCAKP
jgi:hypothetical protein